MHEDQSEVVAALAHQDFGNIMTLGNNDDEEALVEWLNEDAHEDGHSAPFDESMMI